MHVERAELELELLIARMDRHELEPYPDRPPAEPWDRTRQQRLIDTILRGWCIPPVHVTESGPAQPEAVLDGGQRLEAIARFFHDDLTCSGTTAPSHDDVARLDGMRFSDLPVDVRRRVRRFRLTVVTLSDYHAAELAELLDRLHQPERSHPRVPGPRAGDTSGPARVGTHRAPSSLEPIYDQVSAWFADLSEFWGLSAFDDEVEPPRWSSPADAGDSAARAAADNQDLETTDAGLPQREPGAQLVPGAVEPPDAPTPQAGRRRSPQELGGRLMSYQQGLTEGRHDRSTADEDEAILPVPRPTSGSDDRR